MLETDESTRFLAAFEAAEVLCPETASLPAASVGPRGDTLEDWTLMHGGVAANLLVRPLVPRPPSALLHPELAAAYFEKLHAAGAGAFVSRPDLFLPLAEGVFRSLTEKHCLGATALLPLSFRYRGDAPPARWLLRPSHVLEGSERALRASFPPVVVDGEEGLPAAIASASLAFWRAPLEDLLESVSPEVQIHPGNFLLQPMTSVKRAGMARIVTAETGASWAWTVAWGEGPSHAIAAGNAPAQVAQGRGRAELVKAFPLFAVLDAAFDAYLPGGREVILEWEEPVSGAPMAVLRWEEAEVPDPGVYHRASARDHFPSPLRPFDASLEAQRARAADAGRARYLPFRRTRERAMVVDGLGWVFERREAPFTRQARPGFLAGLAASHLLGERCAAWHAGLRLCRLAFEWHAALEETLPKLDALERTLREAGHRGLENGALLAALKGALACSRALAVFEAPVSRWRRMLERAHGSLLSLGHLETASESRSLLAKAPHAHVDDESDTSHVAQLARLATREERERALASGSLSTVHALVVLMEREWARFGPAARPLLRACAAQSAPRLGLSEEEVTFLALREIRAQLQLLESDLQAAGLSNARLEHKVRLRAARHFALAAEDPAKGPVYGTVMTASEGGESGPAELSVEEEGASRAGFDDLDEFDGPNGPGEGLEEEEEEEQEEQEEQGGGAARARPAASTTREPRALPGPAVHLGSEAQADVLELWPDDAARPVAIVPSPFPWLARFLPRLAGVVCAGGSPVCDLVLAGRAVGVPVVTGDGPDVFARHPDEVRNRVGIPTRRAALHDALGGYAAGAVRVVAREGAFARIDPFARTYVHSEVNVAIWDRVDAGTSPSPSGH